MIDFFRIKSIRDVGSGTGRALLTLKPFHPTLKVVRLELSRAVEGLTIADDRFHRLTGCPVLINNVASRSSARPRTPSGASWARSPTPLSSVTPCCASKIRTLRSRSLTKTNSSWIENADLRGARWLGSSPGLLGRNALRALAPGQRRPRRFGSAFEKDEIKTALLSPRWVLVQTRLITGPSCSSHPFLP